MPLPRDRERLGVNAGYIVSAVVIAWLLYLAVMVAKHVNAWPF